MDSNPHVRFGRWLMALSIVVFILGLTVDQNYFADAIMLLFGGAAWQSYAPPIEKAARKVGELIWRDPFMLVMSSGVTSWTALLGMYFGGAEWAWWFVPSVGLVMVGMTLVQIKHPVPQQPRTVGPQPYVSTQPELTAGYRRLGELFEHHGMPDLAADMHSYADLFEFLEALTSAERPAAPEPVVIDPAPADEAPELTQQPYEPDPEDERTEDEVLDAVFEIGRIAAAMEQLFSVPPAVMQVAETPVDYGCLCTRCKVKRAEQVGPLLESISNDVVARKISRWML